MLRIRALARVVARFLPLVAVVACHGDEPQVPTTLAAPSVAVINGTAGTTASVAPTVTLNDQKGHGIANVWVHWKVTSGGGHVVNDSSRTDGAGLAASGEWTLGTTAGAQTLSATASGLPPTIFNALAVAGPVQSLVPIAGAQSGVVNSNVSTAPSVRAVDQYGNAIQGIAVTFSVVSGNGTLSGTQQTTGADGVATLGTWTLGTATGDQSVRAAVASNSAISASFTARAIGGAAVTLVMVEGDAQRGSFGKRLCVSPAVRALDAFGNGTGPVVITFTPSAGSGSVITNTAVTDPSTGRAAVGGWILGSNTTQTLVATSSALPGRQVVFTETAGTPPGYTICARFIGEGGTVRQREAVTKAVARWQTVIVGHSGAGRLFAQAGQCSSGIPASNIDEDVEDLLLYVQLSNIDGVGKVLGQSSPCFLYSNGLSAMGFLQLDLADLGGIEALGELDNVVLHEIGHIIGIGTLWNVPGVRTLLTGAGTNNPFFSGAAARDGFAGTGSVFAGTPVPVENCGLGAPSGCGLGTRDAHWRYSVFTPELMQGYAAPNMPLSRVTIGSLADMGYTVNLAAADPFSLLPALRADAVPVVHEMPNDVADSPIWMIGADGSKTVVRIPINPFRR